ncbi:amidohydrolase family protein [Nannocystis radixulma]|uniref:5-methylthioadenosine/S-adenosylhomocysteine deaminase n=1 Tax=Nannocystis radixulma TaxID=2995305 RepID=A0ABT5AXU0_9BACT|nr:amidohydrolase [Nannocystis radixulma]MDC0666280.1 amidohydrolase [Nannocystis radixulma]
MTVVHIRNVDIVTLDAAGTIVPGGTVVVRDGQIAYVGPGHPDMSLAPDQAADEVVDGRGRALLPGFFNGHCHSPMTFERGWAEDLPFDRWLNEKMWVAESALTPDDVEWGARLAACEMIRGGIVGFNDHYFHMDRVAAVARESGMRAALAWCVFGIGAQSEVGPGFEGTLEWIAALNEHGESQGRIRAVLGPHSPYVCPPEFLRRVAEVAHERGLGVHLHVAESEEQVAQSLARHGRRPVQHVDALGLLDAPGGCVVAHGLALDADDTAVLATRGVHVAHCPITYMKLAMPFPPLAARLDAGVRVCLGTDGPASNSDLDMFAVMRQTVLMEKYQTRDPARLAGDMPLRMATRNGAAALGFLRSGSIEVGAAADLILVNLDAPHMRPRHDLVANLVHAAKAADVTDVMVDGRWLMRGRTLCTLDEERILYEAERRALDMVRRGQHQLRTYRS